MEKDMTKIEKLVVWFTENRNMLFLSVCMAIHVIYLCIFYALAVWPLVLLNIFSSIFYFTYLFLKKDTSESSMAATYFEILLFSVLSEFALGPEYGFVLYIVGMTAAVFYLVPSYGNKRFQYQIIGIITVLILESIIMIGHVRFPEIQEPVAPYQPIFYLVNLAIMAGIVLAATFFYSKETEKVWDTLRYNMNHDVLTGLYNRRFFEQQISQISENKRKPYVISMVDIDFFKKVNDTYGHEAGDIVLAKVSACLMNLAGKENLAVRWGGEEFILYFPKKTPEEVYDMMEGLRKQIEQMAIQADQKTIRVTITSGIGIGLAESNYEKVINSADEKLYLGKQRGRNQVVI